MGITISKKPATARCRSGFLDTPRITGEKTAGNALPIEQFLIAGFAFLFFFPLLFLARNLDDNTLVSWQWIFSGQDFSLFFLALCLIALAAAAGSAILPLENIGSGTLALIVLVSLMPLWGAPEMMLDSGRYSLQARYLAENGLFRFFREWGREIWVWTDLPATALFYGLIRRLLGSSRAAYQLANTLLFCGAVLLTREVGALLWNRRLGVTAALLLLASPFLLCQVPQYLNDAHVLFFLILHLFCLLHLQHERRRRWLLFAPLSAIFLFLSKYSVWPAIVLLPVLVGWGCRDGVQGGTSRYWLTTILGFGILALLFLTYRQTFIAQIELLRSYGAGGLHSWRESYSSTYLFQTHPFVTIAAVAGIVAGIRNKDRKIMVLCWFPLLAVALSMARSRYLIPFFPLLALLAAYGLDNFIALQARRFVIISTVLFSLLLANAAYLPFFRSTSMMNLKLSGEYLDNRKADRFLVRTLPQHQSRGDTGAAIPLLSLYTDKILLLAGDNENPETAPVAYTHPLQFTRSMPLSDFFAAAPEEIEDLPVVIIGDALMARAPLSPIAGRDGHDFFRKTAIFKYQTLVSVRPAPVTD